MSANITAIVEQVGLFNGFVNALCNDLERRDASRFRTMQRRHFVRLLYGHTIYCICRMQVMAASGSDYAGLFRGLDRTSISSSLSKVFLLAFDRPVLETATGIVLSVFQTPVHVLADVRYTAVAAESLDDLGFGHTWGWEYAESVTTGFERYSTRAVQKALNLKKATTGFLGGVSEAKAFEICTPITDTIAAMVNEFALLGPDPLRIISTFR